MTCPLVSDRGLQDFKDYPNFVKTYIKYGLKWWNKPRKKQIRSKEKFATIYDLFVHNVFFDKYEDFRLSTTGMFGNMDCKKFLENYFKIDLS